MARGTPQERDPNQTQEEMLCQWNFTKLSYKYTNITSFELHCAITLSSFMILCKTSSLVYLSILPRDTQSWWLLWEFLCCIVASFPLGFLNPRPQQDRNAMDQDTPSSPVWPICRDSRLLLRKPYIRIGLYVWSRPCTFDLLKSNHYWRWNQPCQELNQSRGLLDASNKSQPSHEGSLDGEWIDCSLVEFDSL